MVKPPHIRMNNSICAVAGAVLIGIGVSSYSHAEPNAVSGDSSSAKEPVNNAVKFAKTTIEIGLRYENSEDRGIIEEFRQLFPFAKQGAGFGLDLPADDPRIKQVLAEFARRGIPRVDYSKAPQKPRPRFEYMLEYHHRYEPADFDSARYLWPQHEVLVSGDQRRDAQGRLMLSSARLPADFAIGCALFDAVVVSDSLRLEMMQAGLVGLRFVEVIPVGQSNGNKLWELKSSVILPPMPQERLIRHEASPEDNVHVGGIRDGDYFPAEMHYAEDALRKVEPFDVAETHEIFCGPGWKEDGNGKRRMVVSQRFRQFCLTRRLKLSWHSPVQIDPAPQAGAISNQR